MDKALLNRYVWLIDTIHNHKKITLKEINALWQYRDDENKPIPNRTFHNHKDAIEELFDIIIECDKQTNSYYIADAEQLTGSVARNWLLNTFTVSNIVNESYKLKNRILFENIPSGQNYLTTIMDAMQKNVVMKISYQKFWSDSAFETEIEPYALKIFRQRWYVLSRNIEKNELRMYALDRLHDAKATEKHFDMPKDFDADLHFANSFGIIVENIEAEIVKLKVSEQQANYIRTLPLHHSQTEEQFDDYSIFTLFLKPSYDFLQEILRNGAEIEILEPQNLRKNMAKMVEAMWKKYKK